MKVLVIGKFLPLHNGHIELFNYASQFGDLNIIIGPRWDEPISAGLRVQWIERYAPINTKVHTVSYELPSEPHHASTEEEFWRLWRTEINRVCPNVDIVVSSEEYGNRLASELNAKHVLFDYNRFTIPISATKIRNDAHRIETWDYIPGKVREYFRKLVVVTGGESCGKTTLVETLTKKYPMLYSPVYEYGRKYMEGRTMDTFTSKDALSIAVHQDIYIENVIRDENRNPIVLSDTDALSTMIWALMSNLPISSDLWRMTKNTVPALTVLIPPLLPWVNDGTREWGDTSTRWAFFNTCIKYLEMYKRPFIVMKGGRDNAENVHSQINDYMKIWNKPYASWRQ